MEGTTRGKKGFTGTNPKILKSATSTNRITGVVAVGTKNVNNAQGATMKKSELKSLLEDVNELMDFNHKPDWAGNKNRILRKAMEELGEYCEALEYADGSKGKAKKLAPATPQEKCREEVVDVVMMGLALAKTEGLTVEEVLEAIRTKITKKCGLVKKQRVEVLGFSEVVPFFKAPPLEFPYDINKGIAVAWAIRDTLLSNGIMPRAQTMALLVFFADLDHIVKYGRPIVGGRYLATTHGPTSEPFEQQLKMYPFQVSPEGMLSTYQNLNHFIFQGMDCLLSESDKDVLNSVLETLGRKSGEDLYKIARSLKMFSNTMHDTVIPYEDFFSGVEGGDSMLEVVREDQEDRRALRGLGRNG